MKEKLFGDKSRFAICIKEAEKVKKFYFRYFFCNTSIGDFKKSGDLATNVKSYIELLGRIDSLYEKKFISMTHREIFDNILDCIDDNYSLEEQNILVERMNRFAFSDDKLGNSLTVLCYKDQKNSVIFLIYKMDGKHKPKFYSFDIEFDYFKQVYSEFIEYVKEFYE
ncbi:hypothetical protein [Ferruginibacter sp.]|nr:hypothetical protein [Ferruginibacter sp.]